jgi:hypothetical protein
VVREGRGGLRGGADGGTDGGTGGIKDHDLLIR